MLGSQSGRRVPGSATTQPRTHWSVRCPTPGEAGTVAPNCLTYERLALNLLDFYECPDGHVAIEQGERLLGAAVGDRYTEAAIQGALSCLYGFAGRFTEARQAIARCRALFAEGDAWLFWASYVLFAGAIELLAGDPIGAENVLRGGIRHTLGRGQRSFTGRRRRSGLQTACTNRDASEEAEQLTAEAETGAFPTRLHRPGLSAHSQGKAAGAGRGR